MQAAVLYPVGGGTSGSLAEAGVSFPVASSNLKCQIMLPERISLFGSPPRWVGKAATQGT